jgi:hypothetical protein
MLAIVGKADGVRAAGDRLGLVEGRVSDGEAVARRQIAVGVVAERRVDDAAELSQFSAS